MFMVGDILVNCVVVLLYLLYVLLCPLYIMLQKITGLIEIR